MRSLIAFARVVEARAGYTGPSVAEELAAASAASPAAAISVPA